MILKFFKGITHLSDARFAAAQGFDYLGLNLDPQQGGISLSDAQEILGWCSGPLLVGNFGDAPEAAVRDGVELLQLDAAIGNHLPEGLDAFTREGNHWVSPEGLRMLVYSGTSNDFAKWLEENQPDGIVFESLQEEKVGLRDFNDLVEILDILEGFSR